MNIFKSVLKLYLDKKLYILILCILIIAISQLNVYSQTIIGSIVDNITTEDVFLYYIVVYITLNVSLYLIKLLYTLTEKSFSFKVTNGLKQRLANKIIKIKFSSLNKYNINDVFQMWNKDIDELQNLSVNTFLNFGMILLSAIFAVVQLVRISIWIPIIAVLINLIAMLPILILSNKSKKASQYLRDTEIGMNEKFLSIFKGIRLVKAFGKEEYEVKQFEKSNQYFVDKKMDSFVINRIHKSLVSVIDSLVQIIVIILGSFAVLNGQMTIGNIVVSITLLSTLNQPFSEIGRIVVNIKSVGFKFENLFTFLSEEDEFREGEILTFPNNFSLCANNVGYSVGQKTFISNINFHVKSGEKIGIVGESGSGKTTLNNLLLRLYEPDEGEITLNGINVNKYNIDSYRENIHYSQSDIYFINDTIRKNLLLFDADEGEIINIAKAIGFHDEICNMENGYDTLINPNASNLSGGQKKKLEIIRAITRKKEIYIFDEITKGIDNKTADAIMLYIINNIKKTMFITMHDMYGIERLDQIFVIKNGHVLDIGKHDELIDRCAYYKELNKNNKRSEKDGISETIL